MVFASATTSVFIDKHLVDRGVVKDVVRFCRLRSIRPHRVTYTCTPDNRCSINTNQNKNQNLMIEDVRGESHTLHMENERHVWEWCIQHSHQSCFDNLLTGDMNQCTPFEEMLIANNIYTNFKNVSIDNGHVNLHYAYMFNRVPLIKQHATVKSVASRPLNFVKCVSIGPTSILVTFEVEKDAHLDNILRALEIDVVSS
jgi:hypothetical protein